MSGTRSKRAPTEDSDSEIPSKKMRGSGDEEERRSSLMSPGPSPLPGLNGLRSRHGGDKPAELFRKDLISAMKLADSDPLQADEFFLISDPWRQEWERGVQVPVNPESIPTPKVAFLEENKKLHGAYAFKLPHKVLHAMHDDNYKKGLHELHETHKLAEQVCRYDLDDQDVHWLVALNEQRETMEDVSVQEWEMEKIMEELESQCHANMQVMIKTVEGLGIEYDENVVCDVCRSPDSEDCNEMVFCDQCDICVHQACYGIQTIPEGNWLCRCCNLGIRPTCILCPKAGGAMKSTKSGSKWAHVSCSLWIPEVSIGCAEKMEPITKISHIPSSRWALICSLCRERTGACIQCSVKTCKTAFHVTCAFQHGLEMKTILEDNEEEIQLKAYCGKHTKKRAEAEGGTPRKESFLTSAGTPKKECEMTEEEKTELRSHRLKKLSEEFYTCIKVPQVAAATQMSEEVVDFIYNYWHLKRKSNFNKPLLTPKTEEADLLSKQQEDSLLARMRMFVHLRQDLERVRNLCYMVTRREKMRRSLYHMKEDIFHRQVELLTNDRQNFGKREMAAIQGAHKSKVEVYDDYDFILQVAQEVCGETSMVGPIDHNLESIRVKHPGRPRLGLSSGNLDSESEGVSLHNHKDTESRRSARSDANKARHKLSLASQQGSHNLGKLVHDKEQVDPRRRQKGEESETVKRGSVKRKLWHQGNQGLKDDAENRRSLSRYHRLSDPHSRHRHHSTHRKDHRNRLENNRHKKTDVNGVLPASKLVVGQSIKEKVQSRLHQGHSLPVNGLRDHTQQKLENFFQSVEDGEVDNIKQDRSNKAFNPVLNNASLSDRDTPRRDSRRLKDGVFSSDRTTPTKDMSGYHIPKKATDNDDTTNRLSPVSKAGRDGDQEPGTPETRSMRRKIESDMESNASERLFENVDGEISIRSSRETTPDREGSLRSAHKDLDFGRLSEQRQLDQRLRSHGLEQGGPLEGPEEHGLPVGGDTDSEYADSEGSGYVTRATRRSRTQVENTDTVSVDSATSSGSKYSTRSRISDQWQRALNPLHS